MIETQIYSTLARYNRWVNQHLLDVCEAIPDEVRKRDLSAPFPSIHATWNHLLVADQIWLGRFLNRPIPFTRLDEEACAEWEEVRRERTRIDVEIEKWASTLTEEALAAPISYLSLVNPTPRTYPLYVCVTHFFNHQTHHRGQMTTLLEQLGVDFGITDLLMLPGVEL